MKQQKNVLNKWPLPTDFSKLYQKSQMTSFHLDARCDFVTLFTLASNNNIASIEPEGFQNIYGVHII